MKTARKKVSYVIQQETTQQAHRLGVNSLALDVEGKALYTAGRDGVVAAWDISLDSKANEEDAKTTILQSLQTHTDWVNDIILAHNNQSVVSGSSDRTVKLWRPHSSTPSALTTIGSHNDFVKCLVYAAKPGWVASGGFDRRIHIWDTQEGRTRSIVNIDSFNHEFKPGQTDVRVTPKASVYSLACNAAGTVLAAGSPEKLIRIWDPRSGQQIGKLTGHTDNVRALLMSDDGSFILSGSSDATIKLWSVKAQRCIGTFETHADSIWSLYSADPTLGVFYAGSRDGIVTRTDLGLNSAGEGECIAIFKENGGVSKLAAYKDDFIWSATSNSSVHQWRGIPDRTIRSGQKPSPECPEVPASSLTQVIAPETYLQAQDSLGYSLGRKSFSRSALSLPLSNIVDDTPLQPLVPVRTAPHHTILGKPGLTAHRMLNNRRHVLTVDTSGEVVLWDIVKCIPLKSFGKQIMEDVAASINTQESYPNWCTLDTRIGAITVHLDENRCFDCELYADEVELPVEFEVREEQRINLGKWVLRYLFDKYISVKQEVFEKVGEVPEEIQNQDFVADIRTPGAMLNIGLATPAIPPPSHSSSSSNVPGLSTIPQSPNGTAPTPQQIGTSAMSHSPSDYFSNHHHGGGSHNTTYSTDPTPPGTANGTPKAIQIPPPAATLPSGPLTPNASIMGRLKHFGTRAKLNRNVSSEGKLDGAKTANDQEAGPSPNIPATNTGDEEGKGEINDGGKTDAEKAIVGLDIPQAPTEPEFSPPPATEVPLLQLPEKTTVIISEESPEASASVDVYRGTVASVGEDSRSIDEAAPSWLLSYLLQNKIPFKDTVKVSFVLRPHEGTALPELPSGNTARLTANRVLRVRKLMTHLVEKLHLNYHELLAANKIAPVNGIESSVDGPSSEQDVKPELWLELLFGDRVLEPTMTLATIKQYVFKQGGDLPLTYRLKSE
ncbi:hypothetical protein BZG36_01381 [Bifiguratus adelaidae]|uniref:Uncharacterized protein n=1 Tax=Bifiguratus adelaidae TaxID=1938954 RepID=A0A261Y3F5_9FUNG|nr:hypothetical protein BZG36_01381 [Bifiguratus adelaidae]